MSTVGKDEEEVRLYIKEQQEKDKRYDQLSLFDLFLEFPL